MRLKSNIICILYSFILAVLLFFFTSSASAFDEKKIIEELLSGIEKKYTAASFETNFTQMSRLQALDITEKASGKAYFSHPKKMVWEYHSPENHKIITNGKELWIYRPDENQVVQGDAAELFKDGAGGAFLADISIVRKNYTVTIKEINDAYAEIELTARVESPDISSIQIRVARNTYEIQKAVTYNIYGDTTLFEFSKIQFKPFDQSMFEFKTPENVNIIQMDQ